MFTANRPDWNTEDFQTLLARLDPSPDQAGIAYERLHRKLAVFFECRPGSAIHALEFADRTIDRVIRKLREDPGLIPHDFQSYVLGFARNIYRELLKRPRPTTLDFDAADPASLKNAEADPDLRLRCLRHCLTRLSSEEYESVLAYYTSEKREKILLRLRTAAETNKSRGALSVRVFRIRRKLEPCIGRCLKALAT
jgi:hypothetical protein